MTVWSQQSIASLGTVTTGSTPRTSEEYFYGGDIPFVTPAELDQIDPITTATRTLSESGSREARLLPEGTVMVCCIGSLGKVGIAGRPVATNQQINSVVFDPRRVWPRFGFYACRLLKSKLQTMAPATTVAIVSKSKFERLEIPVPPLAEQRRIAEVLDRAEALRAKRRAALAQLDALSQAIFLDLFGDPMRSCTHCSRPLSDCAEVVSGIAKGRKLQGRTTVLSPYLRVANVQAGFLDLSEIKMIEALQSEVTELRLLPGDVVLTEGGDFDKLGGGAMWEGQIAACIHQNHVFRVRVDPLLLVPHFFHEYLQTPVARAYFLRCAKRTTNLASINMTQLRSLPVLLPPLALQRDFARRVAAVEKLKTAQRASLAEMDALFASLQHRAFRGEL